MPLPQRFTTPDMRSRLGLIAESHERLTGRPLAPGNADPAETLWSAPRVIGRMASRPIRSSSSAIAPRWTGSRRRSTRSPPCPPRLSAEALREERQALLDRVTRNGFIDDYSGIRISAGDAASASSKRRCGT